MSVQFERAAPVSGQVKLVIGIRPPVHVPGELVIQYIQAKGHCAHAPPKFLWLRGAVVAVHPIVKTGGVGTAHDKGDYPLYRAASDGIGVPLSQY